MPKKLTSKSLEGIDSYHLNGVFYLRERAKLPRVCLFTGEGPAHEGPVILAKEC